jgi:hypothetical protein
MTDHHTPLTPELADALTTLAGQVLDLTRKATEKTPELAWLHVVGALAVACRGLAATAMADDPKLDLDTARQMMTLQFINVMSLPVELVRVMKSKPGEDQQTVVVPVRRH